MGPGGGGVPPLSHRGYTGMKEGYILLQFDSVTGLIFPKSPNILDRALVQS